MREIMCPKCLRNVIPEESPFKCTNGVFHIKGSCPICNKWLKWLPHDQSELIRQFGKRGL